MKYRYLLVILFFVSTAYGWPFGGRQQYQAPCADGQCAVKAPPVKTEQIEIRKIQKFNLNDVEKDLVIKVNAQRVKNRLAELVVDGPLMEAARNHSQWMARNRTLTHSRGSTENIAAGQKDSGEVISAWMKSPGHRRNILGHFTALGVSGYKSVDGTYYWCLQLR